jgi:serine/threonine-protein kinase
MEDQRTGIAHGRVGPGTRLNDTYEIDGLIGSGGMGEIYRGHAIHTGDAVAIKLIRPDMEDNEVALGLFQREASALNRLHHEAIVRYYVFSIDPLVRRHYLAMEFVDGPSLSQLIERGPLDFDDVQALRRRVASALQIAHAGGIIHRDVSPDNIIVPEGDVARAKVIDFGIARSTAPGKGTIIGSGFAGKYNYVSPEQLGLAGGEVTAKSDIYSFGLVLAEALTGKALDMGGREVEVIEKRRSLPNLDAVDPRMRPLIAKMLSPDPAYRPESMAAVANWSAEAVLPPSLAFNGGGKARPKTVAKPAPRRKSNVARRVFGSVALAAMLAGGGFLGYLLLLPPPEPPAKPVTHLTENVPPGKVKPPDTEPKPPAGENKPPAVAPKPPAVEPEPRVPDPKPIAVDPKPQVADPKPPGTEPNSPPASAAAPIVQYVSAYDGGPCFYATAVRVGQKSAGIDAFARTDEAFNALDAAFTKTFGAEPDIAGHVVYSAQCPAVEFLRRTAGGGVPAPLLDLRNTSLTTGKLLSGEVRGYDDRKVILLQIQEDGIVRNVSRNAQDDGDAQVFDVPMVRKVHGGPFPEMLVVITSPEKLDAFEPLTPTAAQAFFRDVTAEAKARNLKLGVAAKMFLLQE